MPKTDAQRQRAYRQRQLEKNGDAQREKEREKTKRQRNLMTEEQRSQLRMKNRLRMKRWRKRGSGNEANENETPDHNDDNTVFAAYRTPTALTKASNRVNRSLPHSPRKRTAVIASLAKRHGVNLFPENAESSSSTGRPSISAAARESAVDFYQSDEASRATPGRSQYRSVKMQDGTKEHIQVRYLLSSMLETYAQFKSANPNLDFGRSAFASLRPANVRLSGETEHNVCLCIHHENFDLLVRAIHSEVQAFPADSRDVLVQGVCSREDRECMLGGCDICGLKSVAGATEAADCGDVVILKQWGTTKAKERHFVTLNETVPSKTASECFELLQEMWPKIKAHCYMQKQQSASFKACRTSLAPNEALLQVDYAENYTCVHQDEVQSAHFGQSNITIFTAVVWYANKDVQSVAIVSNERDHDKYPIFVYVRRLLMMIREDRPNVDTVHIWSDGPSSQFKSRYMFTCATFLYDELHINLTWSYFATSHGKGAVDAIGGTVKRCVWNAVRNRKLEFTVNSAETFYAAAVKTTTIRMMLLLNDEIAAILSELSVKERLASVLKVKDIQQLHHFRPIGLYAVEASRCNGEQTNFLISLTGTAAIETEVLPSAGVNDSEDEENITLNGATEQNESPVMRETPTLFSFWVVEYDLPRSRRTYVGQIQRLFTENDGSECARVQFYRRLRNGATKSMNSVSIADGDTDEVSVSALVTALHVRHQGRHVTFLENLSDISE